jgi:streptogramin lyase
MFARPLALLLFSCSLAAVAIGATQDMGGGFRDHGVAIPISHPRGTVATVDGQGRGVVLSWLMDTRGGYELLCVDVDTGKAQEYPVPFPAGDAPYAAILSSGNKFYTHFNSHFVEFDPARRQYTFCRKTAPQMAMSMTQDDQGRIWSATYPQSGLVCFDPQTRQFTDYGQLYRQDWAEYPRSVATDDAGWVYWGLGSTACQVMAFDPQTRKAEPLVAEAQRVHGSGDVWRGVDGKVYAQPVAGAADNWIVLYRGTATPVGRRPKVARTNYIAGSQGLFHRLLPDGRQIARFDLLERALTVTDPKTRSQKTVTFDYTSEGAAIMAVSAAPDKSLCGGTAFPMRFFQYQPTSDQWTRRSAYGQWNTVGQQGDRFFAGVYSYGCLLEWNPREPWVDTLPDKAQCNPRHLVACHPTICRPDKLLVHPDGRHVVLAGTPGYGFTGGGLLFWDRRSGQSTLLTHEQLLPDHSTASLAPLRNGRLLGGTTTAAGTGGQRKAQQAELYLLDLATRRVEWHAPVLPGVQSYTDLCRGPDGLVWGFADLREFFVFDPAQRKLVHRQSTHAEFGPTVSHQGPRAFVAGPQGTMYVLFVRAIARIEPQGWHFKLLAKPPQPIANGGDLLDGRIYYACRSHVWSYELPNRRHD